MPEFSEAERDYIAEFLMLPTHGKKEGAEMAASILSRLERPVKVVVVEGWDDDEQYELERVS